MSVHNSNALISFDTFAQRACWRVVKAHKRPTMFASVRYRNVLARKPPQSINKRFQIAWQRHLESQPFARARVVELQFFRV